MTLALYLDDNKDKVNGLVICLQLLVFSLCNKQTGILHAVVCHPARNIVDDYHYPCLNMIHTRKIDNIMTIKNDFGLQFLSILLDLIVLDHNHYNVNSVQELI